MGDRVDRSGRPVPDVEEAISPTPETGQRQIDHDREHDRGRTAQSNQ